jgi:hypothetical protein
MVASVVSRRSLGRDLSQTEASPTSEILVFLVKGTGFAHEKTDAIRHPLIIVTKRNDIDVRALREHSFGRVRDDREDRARFATQTLATVLTTRTISLKLGPTAKL